MEQFGTSIHVLFTDIHMPGPMDGLELTELAHRRWPHLQLVVTSGRSRISSKQVADDGKFIPKPYDFAQLEKVIQRTNS
ncbi:response regulator [Rhodoligotrophos appendicifer]|uniref:response regulator n=1 Tax=Rhodoligotrophos appendicifer TaxID=987056 RepID=UPI003D253584